MKKIILAVFVLVFLVACVPQPQLTKKTESGYPETIYKNDSLERVRGVITQGCLNKGLMVEDSSVSQVVCSSEITGTMEIMSATLILNGNASSSTPREKIRFVIFNVQDGIKVTAQPTMELQMSGGATRSARVTNTRELNGLQEFLDFLPGTGLYTQPAKEPLYGPRIRN